MVVQRTLALIKPDCFGRPWLDELLEKNDEEPPEFDEEDEDAEPPPMPEPWKAAPEERSPDMAVQMLDRISKAGFTIVKKKTMQWTIQDAAQFYAEHKGKPFYEGLIAHMSSAPLLAMVLEKENAIADWRALIGPTNPDKAREEAEAAHPFDESEWSLRALFGKGGPKNAAHGSDSPFSAMREMSVLFPPSAPAYERTFLTLGGDAAGSADAVAADLAKDQFIVVARAVKAGKAGLVVEGVDAVRRLQLRAGPPDVATAREGAPSSLRALYGDSVTTATSTAEAAEQQAAFFPDALPVERTLAVIKPGVAAEHGENISRELRARGFTVLAETRTRLSPSDARGLLAAQSSSPTFASQVRYMSSGQVIALALAKPAAVATLQALLGPASSEEAAREQPSTLRGRYGTDGVANAVHGSADADAANKEIAFFFPHLHPTPLLTGDDATAYVRDTEVGTVDTPMGAVPTTLHGTLVRGLTELCKSKPTGLEAVAWLGQWLLANNPSAATPSAPPMSAALAADEGVEESKEGAVAVAPPAGGAAAAPPSVVFVLGGDDSTTTLCTRLADKFGYTRINAAESSGATAEQAVAGVKEAIAKAHGNRFILQGFPSSLDQAFLFERSCAQPTFVLNDGDDGEVGDFYSKLGLAHAVTGQGDEAFEAASHWFRPQMVYFLGPPGSRRTELAHAACDTFGYTYLSLEGLVRTEAESGSRFGRDLADTIARGDQLPMDSILRLFREAVEPNPTGRFVVDGFPRTQEQANALSDALASPRFVVRLDCPDDECLRREGAAAKKGIRVFNGRTVHYLAHAAALGLVRAIDANRPTTQVFADVKTAFAPEVVFMLGGPGSGKGTQCARMTAEFGHVHLSAGDLLRAEVARQSADGQMLNDYMRKGQLVPVEVTLGLLQRAMSLSANSRFLIDGFPRATDQAVAFEDAVCAPHAVVYLEADDATLVERIKKRAESSSRVDDDPSVIQSRLDTFHSQSEPVIERYAQAGSVIVVDGSQSPDDVARSISSSFQPRVVMATGAGLDAQCARVSSQFGYTHLNVPQMIQSEIALGTYTGQRLEKMVKADDVPADEIVAVVTAAVARSGRSKFLLQGFPRTSDEANMLEGTQLTPAAWVHIDSASTQAPEALAATMRQYTEEGRLFSVKADGASDDDVFAEVRKVFQPELVVLVGATGSGRGEFCRRAGKKLGYARLRVTSLLREEAESGSAVGKVVARAMAARRTVPTDAVLAVLRAAIGRSTARRFFLDGYPRVVSDGYPSVQDQVFSLEQGLGPVRGVIVLEASADQRRSRVADVLTPGQERQLAASVEAYQREKLAVLSFFDKLGKVHRIDTGRSPDDVFADASAYIE